MMGAQVGVFSSYQMGLHNHLNDAQGGALNEYSRDGAYRRPYRAGALAVHIDSDAERSTASAIYTKLKEIRIETAQPGRYRIAWQARSDDVGQDIKTRFHVNGAIVSPEMTEGVVAYQDESHNYDVDLAAGDLLQIFGKRVGATTCYVRNFRIYYDWRIEYFGDGSRNTLVTALPVSDADLLDFTAVL
jgi:hypothetical protein